MKNTEDALVEQPTIQLFSELSRETITCWDEVFGRETRNDVVVFTRLKAALLKLNQDVNLFLIQEAMDKNTNAL